MTALHPPIHTPCIKVNINSVYQIFPDEVLGSGQFGIVYGGKTHLNAVNRNMSSLNSIVQKVSRENI